MVFDPGTVSYCISFGMISPLQCLLLRILNQLLNSVHVVAEIIVPTSQTPCAPFQTVGLFSTVHQSAPCVM